jgi:O-antigen/teichoic acid export membrane protein
LQKQYQRVAAPFAAVQNWVRTLLQTPVLRNGLALITSSGLTSGMGLLYWILAARLYPASVVGTNSAWLSAMTLLAGIAELSLHTAMTRFIPTAGRATRQLVSVVYVVTVGLSLLAGVLYTLLTRTLFAGRAGVLTSTVSIAAFTLATAICCLFALQDSVLTGLRQVRWVIAENAIFALVKIVLLVALLPVLPLYGVFVSWLIGMLVVLVPLTFLIFRRFLASHMAVAPTIEAITFPLIARFVGGNYVAYLFSLFSTWGLPILVAAQLGSEATAYFYLPWSISESLMLVAANMATSMTVEASSDQAQLHVYLRQVRSTVARMIIPAVIIVELVAPYALLVFGRNYSEAGTMLLRLLVLCAIPNMIVSTFTGVARVRRSIRGLILVQAVSCAGVFGLTELLMPTLGITGVGVAWLTSQTVVALGILGYEWIMRQRAVRS